MTFQRDGTVVINRRVKSSYFLLRLHCPEIADNIRPGQFVMLRISDHHSPLLRRPFSVYKSYPYGSPEKGKRGDIVLLYKRVGKGTQMMTRFRKGQKINLIGPLGNGFTLPIPSLSGDVILIGGGVGIVSLYPVAEAFRKAGLWVLIGGKSRDDILCVRDYRKLDSHVLIATEDGSLGFKGTVVDLFLSQRKRFETKKPPHYLYACGPTEMVKELAKRVVSKSFVCQVSLETRMACGFGACWGCVVKTVHPQTPYQRVCKEGPVFDLKDIEWD